jgi:hypothetical protein
MPLKLRSHQAISSRLAPVEPRHAAPFCFALLAVSCALASFALACATPFAAFAVVAASMLTFRPALLVVTAAWLVNQGIGFGALHYPIETNTMLWGLAIGIAALAATAMSAIMLRLLPQGRTPLSMPVALALTLAGAYIVYELVLLAATPFLGGAGSFTAAIVARIGVLNIAWLIGLVVACEIARLLNPFRRGVMRFPERERPACTGSAAVTLFRPFWWWRGRPQGANNRLYEKPNVRNAMQG